MKNKEYQFHPLADMFPMMRSDELASLAVDMQGNGQKEDILLLDGKILDGRNRYRAGQEADIKLRFRQVTGADAKNPMALVNSLNLERRHLDASQRSLIGAKLADLAQGKHEDSGKTAKTTQKEAAKAVGVSVASLKHGKAVNDKAVPEVQEAVKSGKLAVHKGAKLAKLPKQKQTKIAKGGVKAMENATKPAPRGGLANEAHLDEARAAGKTDASIIKRLLSKLDEYWSETKRVITTETPGTVFNACRAIVESEMK
jgi:hypothetical protein